MLVLYRKMVVTLMIVRLVVVVKTFYRNNGKMEYRSVLVIKINSYKKNKTRFNILKNIASLLVSKF